VGGLRPEEKLYEEPLAEGENLLPTPHPKIKIARARPENGDWLLQLESRLAAWQPPDEAAVKSELRKWVQEYLPATPEIRES